MSPSQTSDCLTRQLLERYSRGILQGELVENCEEHLKTCTGCQAVLAELFECGYRPDWLSTSLHAASLPSASVRSQSIDSQLSTLSAAKDPTSLDGVQGAAHQLWQHLAIHPLPPEATTESCRVPSTLGRYRIERILGNGGFGRVYLAYDEKLKRNVALKVPHLNAHKTQIHWDLMLAEAQTVAALDHPAIVPIYDVATTDDVPLFLVSKLIVGRTLADRMSEGAIDPREAANVVLRVADALQYAHEQGVVHRDIKPQNILLDDEGQVFLSDFGLAWRGTDDCRTFPTAGTPFYMSPEQVTGDADLIDARSDIYSLGRVFQEMLSEIRPGPIASPGQSGSLANVVAPAVSQLASTNKLTASSTDSSHVVWYAANVPTELIAVCEKATAIDPAARYQHVHELRTALRASLVTQLPQRSASRRNLLVASLLIPAAIATAMITQPNTPSAPHVEVVDMPEDLPGCVELMLHCPPHVFESIVERWRDELPQIVALLREQLTESHPPKEMSLLDIERRHAAALALLKLGHEDDYWSIWRTRSDPRTITVQLAQYGRDALSASRFIDRLRTSEAIKPITSLPSNYVGRLFGMPFSERRNLLMALATGKSNTFKECDTDFLNEVGQLYRLDADPGVHVLAEKILRRAQVPLPQLDSSAREVVQDRGWFVNSLGEPMMIVNPNPSVIYRFCIASCEVQEQQFQEFLKDTGYAWKALRESEDGANKPIDGCRAQGGLSWYDCAAFCNWLSRREGLDECYTPNTEGKYAEGMTITPNILSMNGYRIPTAGEWETAARAGAFADWYFGHAPFAKREYLWDASNAHGVAQPVGQLRPNNLGLFDIHGNVSEWTMGLEYEEGLPSQVNNRMRFAHLGGSAQASDLAEFTFDKMPYAEAHSHSQLIGLRVVRSLPEN